MEVKELVKALQQYSQDLIAFNLDAEFAYAVDQSASALESMQEELDRVKAERDAAVKDISEIIGDIEEIRRGYGVDNADADNAFADLCGNYCSNNGHRCYEESEKYRCKHFKWRGLEGRNA